MPVYNGCVLVVDITDWRKCTAITYAKIIDFISFFLTIITFKSQRFDCEKFDKVLQ